VEYQRIKLVWHGLHRLCPGASTATRVPFLGGVVLCGTRRGVVCVGLCLAHCWVLRQQDLFAAMRRASSGVSFVPASGTYHRVPVRGVVVVWLTGLLFENYIVDASI
jgi:hypothetical protein